MLVGVADKYIAVLHGFSVEGMDSFANPVGKHDITRSLQYKEMRISIFCRLKNYTVATMYVHCAL